MADGSKTCCDLRSALSSPYDRLFAPRSGRYDGDAALGLVFEELDVVARLLRQLIEARHDKGGVYTPKWSDYRVIIGVPHDMPVVGYGGRTVNVLRLYSARASDEFDIGIFNSGDYVRAVQEKISTEAISKVLYPSDLVASGRELRLLQEYFLVACSVSDIIRRYRLTHESFDSFSSKVAVQMNDTHPALTVAELMRVFIDGHHMFLPCALI